MDFFLLCFIFFLIVSHFETRFEISKPEKPSSESYIKRKSPSIISTSSNVDQGVSGSDDEGLLVSFH